MKEVTITFEPDGSYSIETSGFHGAGCQDLMKALAGDDQLLDEQKKPEFYESQEQTETARS